MFTLAAWIRGGFIAVVSGIFGVLAGASRLFGRREREMLQVFFFVISALLIVAAAYWWVQSVYENYLAGERPPSLGAVEIHGGGEGSTEALKREFPSLVLSELNALQQKANSAIASIREARQSIGSTAQLPADTRFQDVEAPSLLTAPFDVDLKIADVDVGSLLSWLSKRTAETNQLKLNIVYKDASNVTIYGTVAGRPAYSFSAQAAGTVEAIVREVATVIIQKEAVKSDERLVSLDADSFSTLIESLNALALIEKESLYLNADKIAKNKALFVRLKDAGGFTQFPELQWLMAKTAENAELWSDAVIYYRNLLAYYDSGRATNLTPEELSARRQEILDKVAGLQDREAARAAVAAAADPDAPQEPLGLAKLKAGAICGDYSPIWQGLGIGRALAADGVLIGTVGAPSQAVAEALRGSIVGTTRSESAEASQANSIDDYLASVTQTIRAVAKDPPFLFSGPSGTAASGDSGIIGSLRELAEAEQVKVVFMTFGTLSGTELNPAYRAIVDSRRDQVVFVFAAGNVNEKATFAKSSYAPLADVALVSQALDQEGKAAYFTASAEGGVWTRGVDIPYCSLSSGEATTGSGTSFSAALVAALAAGLAKEFPKATSPQIVSAMKSASGGAPTSPVPLTYPAAKAKLQALLTPTQ